MTTTKAQRVAFGETLVELIDQDPRILVLDGDLANSTRADIVANARPERFFEMGIAEQNMAGVAAGLATLGFIPFISTFAAFSAKRDLDQIRVVIAQPGLHVIITGAYSGILTGKTGKTHQSVEDITIFRAMPNMTVVAPADDVEVRKAMHALVYDLNGPAYLRLTRDPYKTIFDDSYHFQIGKGVVLADGEDVALIGTGEQTVRCLEAADLLGAEGIRAYVLHLPTIKPLDEEAIIHAARRTGRVVTAEDHTILGGLGGAVAETLSEHYPTPMKRVGWRDVYGESADNNALLEKYGLTPRHIAEAAKALLK
ncbi:MAG: transketolase C-terminal domain-containing protein [Anaerolineales bacterium]|nr:transketolase C-terminal domain-containing protein [Anaerolineales bacterium]